MFTMKITLDIRKEANSSDEAVHDEVLFEEAAPRCEILSSDIFSDAELDQYSPLVLEIIGDEQPEYEFEKLLENTQFFMNLRNTVFITAYLEANNLVLVPRENSH